MAPLAILALAIPALLVLALLVPPGLTAQTVPTGALDEVEDSVSVDLPGAAFPGAYPGPSPWTFPVDPESAPRPEVRAVRTHEPIVIDGRMDEAAWDLAIPVGHFVQGVPDLGMPATQPTVVRILYDDTHLYLGVVNYDSEMDRLMIAGLEHDFSPGAGDLFAVSIDPFLDRRNSFLFFVNPGGALRDEQTFNDSRNVSVAWEGPIQAQVAHTDSAWVVEMAIPFSTLRFDANRPVQDWGINFLRRVRRSNESSYWSPLSRREVIHRMSRAGTMTGLEGIQPGRNLTVKPFALAADSRGQAVADAQTGSRADAGVDLKYGITPGLTMDLTYRTDFAQAELDQEQVNLTRFSLFFPERREFFIENAGVFQFGDQNERNYRMGASLRDFTLFHSRRIGLTQGGEPIPIVGGGRVTGRAGDFEVGVLNMQTEAFGERPGENFSVARVKRNVLGNSDIGLLVVNRQGTGELGQGSYNRSWGADANLRLLGNLVITSYLAGTAGSEPGSSGFAWRTGAAWRDRFWNTSAFVRRVDEDFDPGVGFVRRRDALHRYATVGIHHQPEGSWLQEAAPYVEVDYISNLGGLLETRIVSGGLNLSVRSGESFSVTVNDRFERLGDPFAIASGVVLQPGDYAFRDAVVSVESSSARSLIGRVQVGRGEFWSGTRTSLSTRASWRPRYDLFTEISMERNEVELPEGDFRADVARGALRYAWSTRLSGSAFLQYNRQTEQWVSNTRINFRHAPMSDVFLIFTQRHRSGMDGPQERSVALKVTRLVAF
ncbi:MAG: hypothetical protein EA422_15300 [Gemmatimonadales bacterium]|nr:MAG: hypothetical protein EA422_15300 [Gemmatimonadales bacterium]